MRPARERFGLDGKARATSRPAVVCKERATPPDGPKRSRPKGCFAFWPGRRCSSVTDHCGYAPSSRLGQAKNRSNAGHMGISTDSYAIRESSSALRISEERLLPLENQLIGSGHGARYENLDEPPSFR